LTGTVDGLAIVVVAYNSAAHLPSLLGALLGQIGEDDEVIVVDNGSDDDGAAVARAMSDRVQVMETGANLGFGGGCHTGVEATRSPLLVFLNPDSMPAPGCLAALRAAAGAHPDWGAWQAAVLMDGGERINTDGGVLHFTGVGWAGHCGAPTRTLPTAATEVAFPSGAATVIRRSQWEELGGFDADYFMYCEDSDFGLRVWSGGRGVGLVPEAQVIHDYAFDKGAAKWFYLERNRLRTVLSVYPPMLLTLLAPALMALELVMLALAARQGWLIAKLRADRAVLRELGEITRRRRRVQAARRIDERGFAARLTASLESDYLGIDAASAAARLQAGYWALVLRALSASRR
jgi:N-acetylglucosaminyl-diphospho-decaprenol L-rhamnosyltransferase